MRWIVGPALVLAIALGAAPAARAAVQEVHFGGTLSGNFLQPSPWDHAHLPYTATLRIDMSVPGTIENVHHQLGPELPGTLLGPLGSYVGAVELDLHLDGFSVTGWQGDLIATDFVWGEGAALEERIMSPYFYDGVLLSWSGAPGGGQLDLTLAMQSTGDMLAGVGLDAVVAALIGGLTGSPGHPPVAIDLAGAGHGAAGGGAALIETPLPAAGVLFVGALAGLGLWRRRARG